MLMIILSSLAGISAAGIVWFGWGLLATMKVARNTVPETTAPMPPPQEDEPEEEVLETNV